MLRTAAAKVAWVGRTTSMVFGLALVLALLFGVASMALAGTGVNGVFNLGVKNTVDAMTQLVSNPGTGPAGPMLRVDNNGTATGATGLQILTEAGNPPMTVSSTTRVARLNADRIDDREASSFANGVGGVATNADLLDNKDSAYFLAAKLPAVRVNSPTVSVLGDSTRTLLDFSAEDFDQVSADQSGEMHSTTTNSSRLTAPRNGIYQVNVQIGWDGTNSVGGWRAAGLMVNQNGVCPGAGNVAFDRTNATGDTSPTYNHLNTLLALNQGDYVEVCAWQTSGATLGLSPGGSHSTHATMNFVSGQ